MSADFFEEEIERRSKRAKKLAKRFADLPKGLTFEAFIQHPEIEALELDFITADQMFKAYQVQNKVKRK